MKKHVEMLLQDFLLNDRRIAERADIEAHLKWGNAPAIKPVKGGYAGMTSSPNFPRQFSFMDKKRMGEVDITFTDGPSERDLNDLRLLAFLAAYFGTSLALPPILGEELKAIRESLGLERAAIAQMIGASEDLLSQWELKGRSPKGSEMYRWCRALGIVAPATEALVRVVDFSPQLLRFLQEDPKRLASLTPDQFERFVAERLDQMGYHVTLTGPTNRKDGGIDVIAVPKRSNLGFFVIAGQMKHHRDERKTGVEAVDRLLAWNGSGQFHVGLLVTNTGFTADALWKAQLGSNSRFLRLRDFGDLKRWLENRFGEEEDWREIPDTIEIAPGIVIDIPRPRLMKH